MAELFYQRPCSVSPGALPTFLRDGLPLAERTDRESLVSLASALAKQIGLGGGVALASCAGSVDFTAAWRCRMLAWDGEDPYREALHRTGIQSYWAADRGNGWQRMSSAYAAAEAQVNGPAWRAQLLRILAREPDEHSRAYLRCFFRAAQQAWTRAARWISVMPPDEPSPFELIVRLATFGAWPLGFCNGQLIVAVYGNQPDVDTTVEALSTSCPPRVLPTPDSPPCVFLATSFRTCETGERVRQMIEKTGHRVLYGPLPERNETLESQLGRRIGAATAVLAVVDIFDADFGLPIWISEEVHYAVACARPVAMVGAAMEPEPAPFPVHEMPIEAIEDWLIMVLRRKT